MGQRKFGITPELALPIWYECPFALGHNLYYRCIQDQWIFSLGGVYAASETWTEIPGMAQSQIQSPSWYKRNTAHNNQRNKALNSMQKFYWVD